MKISNLDFVCLDKRSIDIRATDTQTVTPAVYAKLGSLFPSSGLYFNRQLQKFYLPPKKVNKHICQNEKLRFAKVVCNSVSKDVIAAC